MDAPERIAHFENALNELCAAIDGLDSALERFAAVQDAADELDAYYFGGPWPEDFEADRRGELPPVSELPRGVLSEDAAYNALCERRELLERMRALAARCLPDCGEARQ